MKNCVNICSLTCDQIAENVEELLREHEPVEEIFRYVNNVAYGHPFIESYAYSVRLTRDMMRLEPEYGRIVWDIIRAFDQNNHTLDKARKISAYTYEPLMSVLDKMVAQAAVA